MVLDKRLGPNSSEVEHLHGKQAVVGSIPILGKEKSNLHMPTEEFKNG